MTAQQTPLAVIEEALRAAAYTDDFAPDYAAANAPAILARVLAALGGEPPVAWLTRSFTPPNDPFVCGPGGIGAFPVYAHPAPPIDLAAVRAVAVEMRELNKLGYVKELPIRYAADWADRLLRAIGDAK